MLRTIVLGAPGKMGRRVMALLANDPELTLVGAIAHDAHAVLGRDAGELAGVGSLGVPLTHDLSALLSQADVVIDFSVASATLTHLPAIAKAHKALVVGTTGFTASQREDIARTSADLRCFMAPNMSLGVNVLFHVLRVAAGMLGPEYDVEIIEAHHRTKVDAPSGTALRMGSIIAEALGRDLEREAIYGRHGMVGRRSGTEIGIQAVRGGDIVGEHTVMFAGTGERLEFIHRSQSRDNFALGALRAAKWIVHQPAGLYSMEDLLGLAASD